MQEVKVKLQLVTEMLGTAPKNKEVYETYIDTKRPDGGKDEIDIEAVEERGWTGIRSDEKGLFIFDYMVKGFLKHWGNVKKDAPGFKVKALRSKIDDVVFINPRKVYLYKDGILIKEPTGVVERPLTAMTMKGPRTSLARSDKVDEGTTLEFTITLIDTGKNEITVDKIRALLDYGNLSGLGQFRNGGYGRFKVVEFAEV